MAMQTMYPAVNNSVPTTLAGAVTAAGTTMDLAAGSVLPEGPNLATLGTDDNAEVICYAQRSGNRLTGCVRGFGGTEAQIWPVGTAVCRAFTAYDHDAFCGNIRALAAEKLAADGEASEATVKFARAGSRANLASGETLAKALGKVSRWFADLGAAAFAAIGTAAGTVAAGDHAHSQYAQLTAEGKVLPEAISMQSVHVDMSRVLRLSDAGKSLLVYTGGPGVVTIPKETTVAFPNDTEIEVVWHSNSGAVTVMPASGVIICKSSGSATPVVELKGAYSAVRLKKLDGNLWRATGDML